MIGVFYRYFEFGPTWSSTNLNTNQSLWILQEFIKSIYYSQPNPTCQCGSTIVVRMDVKSMMRPGGYTVKVVLQDFLLHGVQCSATIRMSLPRITSQSPPHVLWNILRENEIVFFQEYTILQWRHLKSCPPRPTVLWFPCSVQKQFLYSTSVQAFRISKIGTHTIYTSDSLQSIQLVIITLCLGFSALPDY